MCDLSIECLSLSELCDFVDECSLLFLGLDMFFNSFLCGR